MYRSAAIQNPENLTNLNAPGEVLAQQAAYFSKNVITRHLLDAMPGIVLVLNQYRQIIYSNRTLHAMLGTEDAESLLGKRPGDVLDCRSAQVADQGCGTGEACKTCGALTAILSGLEGCEDVQECLLTRNGRAGIEHLTLRVWSSPVRFGDDQFTVLSGMDISHERRRLALERTFFHDILNLVGSIRGFAELMELDQDLDSSVISRRIQSAAQRVVDEIDAQRLLLAAEKGELQANLQLLSSRTFLNELVAIYRGQDISRHLHLDVSAASQDITFLGDPAILGRIVGNMLKNALEASQPGQEVTLGSYQEDQQLTLWVHNQAVIPAENLPRVFQRDFSTKGCGRGLGTYGMKLLAQLLNGEVSFSSAAGEGTTFQLSLPTVLK